MKQDDYRYDSPSPPPDHVSGGRPGNSGDRAVRGRAKRHYLWALQIVLVVISYLGRSSIARFLTAKLGLSAVVEVTDRFGKSAGHHLSTVISVFIAEPRLIAVAVAGILLVIDLIVFVVGRIRGRLRKREAPRQPYLSEREKQKAVKAMREKHEAEMTRLREKQEKELTDLMDDFHS